MKPHPLKKPFSFNRQTPSHFNYDTIQSKKPKPKKSTTSSIKLSGSKFPTSQTPRASTHRKNSSSNIQTQQPTKYFNPQHQLALQSLAQTTTDKLYIRELQEKNAFFIEKIQKLQLQLEQKDLLLDQCEGQIAFLKQKFIELFSDYHRGRQQKSMMNQGIKLNDQRLADERDEVMRRIQYSEDTLKLSQASSSIRGSQTGQNFILHESSFEFCDSDVREGENVESQKESLVQIKERTPLKDIQNRNPFVKKEPINPKIVLLYSAGDQNKTNHQNISKTQQNYQCSEGLVQRKHSVSAITSTHRLAAFYHKKHQ